MATWKDSLLVIVSVVTTFSVSGTLACMCQMKHPQQHACEADYIIKGRVLAKTPYSPEGDVFTGRFEYRVKVQRDFKGEMETEEKIEVKLLTPASEALCGLSTLMEGKTYIIAGGKSDEGMILSMCDWIMEWSTLTKSQRNAIKNIYKIYCEKCEIRIGDPSMHHFIGETTPEPLNPFQGCVYDPYGSLRHGTEDCEAKHASCAIQDNGTCSWMGNAAYLDCLDTRNKALENDQQD